MTYPLMEKVNPVAQPLKKQSFNLLQRIERKLEELKKMDVIEKATGPTTWISPVVIEPKKNDIRLCINMKQAKTAIIRELHPIPTLDEILHDFNRSKKEKTIREKGLTLNKKKCKLRMTELVLVIRFTI